MKKILFILMSISIFLSGCFSYIARYDHTFYGRVVDADTREPIEGVVVLGTWYTRWWDATKFYDAEETVTDKDGNFSIRGKGIRIMSNLEPVNLLIFKAGYSYAGGTWYSFKEGILYKEIKWEEGKAIIPLKKLTMEERRKELGPPSPPSEARKEKIKLMIQEINKDRREQGLGPIDVGR